MGKPHQLVENSGTNFAAILATVTLGSSRLVDTLNYQQVCWTS